MWSGEVTVEVWQVEVISILTCFSGKWRGQECWLGTRPAHRPPTPTPAFHPQAPISGAWPQALGLSASSEAALPLEMKPLSTPGDVS